MPCFLRLRFYKKKEQVNTQVSDRKRQQAFGGEFARNITD